MKQAIAIGVFAIFGVALSADDVSDVKEIQENMARALELRQKRADEEDAWRRLEPELVSLIQLTEVENGELEKQVTELESLISGYEERVASTQADIEESQELLSEMQSRYGAFDEAFESLIGRLPGRLKERGISLQQRTRQRVADGDRSAMRRGVELYLDFLAELLEFDRQTQIFTETRVGENGKNVAYSVIYLGLGSAFFISEDQTSAGRIHFSNTGSKWEPDNNLLPAIALAKQILIGAEEPEFIPLPVSVSKGGAK